MKQPSITCHDLNHGSLRSVSKYTISFGSVDDLWPTYCSIFYTGYASESRKTDKDNNNVYLIMRLY